jgi:hypothetical protein
MNLPYGEIRENLLTMKFSTADFSIASVLNAIKLHIDVIEEMNVVFLGAQTEVVAGPTPVFQPVPVIARFEYAVKGSAKEIISRRDMLGSGQGCVRVFHRRPGRTLEGENRVNKRVGRSTKK